MLQTTALYTRFTCLASIPRLHCIALHYITFRCIT